MEQNSTSCKLLKQRGYSTIRLGFAILLLLLSIKNIPHAHAAENKWWEDAQDQLDEGKRDSALFTLDGAAGRINELSNPLEQVTTLRRLGELYYEAEKPSLSASAFSQALGRSLDLPRAHDRLTATLAILKTHRRVVENHQGLQELLQETLQKQLLTTTLRGSSAKQVTAYIAAFRHAANYSQALQLLREMRELDAPWLRKAVLLKLSSIQLIEDKRFFLEVVPSPHYEATADEQFLWNYFFAKLYRPTPKKAQYKEYFNRATHLLAEVSSPFRHKGKRMLAALKKLPDDEAN
jgi:hypothetical protein